MVYKPAVISEESLDKELDQYYQDSFGVTFSNLINDLPEWINEKEIINNTKSIKIYSEKLDKLVNKTKELVDNKEKRFKTSQMAFKHIVKLITQKNDKYCNIINSINCH